MLFHIDVLSNSLRTDAILKKNQLEDIFVSLLLEDQSLDDWVKVIGDCPDRRTCWKLLDESITLPENLGDMWNECREKGKLFDPHETNEAKCLPLFYEFLRTLAQQLQRDDRMFYDTKRERKKGCSYPDAAFLRTNYTKTMEHKIPELALFSMEFKAYFKVSTKTIKRTQEKPWELNSSGTAANTPRYGLKEQIVRCIKGYKSNYTASVYQFFCITNGKYWSFGRLQLSQFYLWMTPIFDMDFTSDKPPDAFRWLVYCFLASDKLQASALPRDFPILPEPGVSLQPSLSFAATDNNLQTVHYTADRLLGRGASSRVYRVFTEDNPSVYYAMKIASSGDDFTLMQMFNEQRALKHLEGIPGVPKLISTGTIDIPNEGSYIYNIISPVGYPISRLNKLDLGKSNLEYIWKRVEGIITSIHERGVTLQDIKPEHMIATYEGIYLIDFGAATFNQGSAKHILEELDVIYTPAYAARDILLGKRPSQRTDWETLLYCFYDIAAGLPWRYQPENAISLSERERILEEVQRTTKRRRLNLPDSISSRVELCKGKSNSIVENTESNLS